MITNFILSQNNIHDFASILVATPGLAKGVANVKCKQRTGFSPTKGKKIYIYTKDWIQYYSKAAHIIFGLPLF